MSDLSAFANLLAYGATMFTAVAATTYFNSSSTTPALTISSLDLLPTRCHCEVIIPPIRYITWKAANKTLNPANVSTNAAGAQVTIVTATAWTGQHWFIGTTAV